MNHSNRSANGFRNAAQRSGLLRAAVWSRCICLLVQAALLSVSGPSPSRAQAVPSLEYQLKAAFLLNFAKFIEWPPDAIPGNMTPLAICVFKYDPFGSALEEILRGKNINDRALVARRVKDLQELRSCQVLFVSAKEDKSLPDILSSARGSSLLVVGESEDFAQRGGGIQFVLEANKLRFAVNVDALQRARLSVSAKLLTMAKIVHDSDHPKGN